MGIARIKCAYCNHIASNDEFMDMHKRLEHSDQITLAEELERAERIRQRRHS